MEQNRVYNFSAGPSILPNEVLEIIGSSLYNYNGSGMSVMEMSHRSKIYADIFNDVKAAIRRVMNVPDNYEILFVQGGATEQFSAIPQNLMKNGKADYIVTGLFSSKAEKEAEKFGEINVIYDGEKDNYRKLPSLDELKYADDSDYVYFCLNNTVYGTEWKNIPKTDKVLVCDMSSDILSKDIDVNDFGLIFAGAQKNMGIAGIAVVIVRKDLLSLNEDKNMPVLQNYASQAKEGSMVNTPATFSIYVCGEVVKWVERNGGVKAMAEKSKQKAKILYDILDNSSFYIPHADKESRSNMNITFKTPSKELDEKFVEEASKLGMVNLKGHKATGGIRASIYNAMPIEGVEKLAKFMIDFENKNI